MKTVTTAAVSDHYDSMARVYRYFWGEHLHHGLFISGDEPPRHAQEQMLEFCARKLALSQGAAVLDVGCGYGGTAVYLARNFNARVTGITLSRKQVEFASNSARRCGVHERVRFLVADAEHYPFGESNYDVVWTMESSEHFHDRPAFFKKAANALQPQGKLLVAAWTSACPDGSLAPLAEAALCQQFARPTDYAEQVRAAGLRVLVLQDLTQHVIRTWEICRRRAQLVRPFKVLFPQAARDFAPVINLMLCAFETGALSYTVLVAQK
ncbi:MAG: cyclopropane-fatty-acyl-phospholipid synthase family protein [Terriglobales bacterium]